MSAPRINAKPTRAVMRVADLRPAPYNPRTIDDAALKGLEESLLRFGVVEPIIVNKRLGNRVVGGHQRLQVLKNNLVTETEVVVVDLTKSEEKALNVALNNPHIAGSFDQEKLQALLVELSFQESALFSELRLDELVSDGHRAAAESDGPLEAADTIRFEIAFDTSAQLAAWNTLLDWIKRYHKEPTIGARIAAFASDITSRG